MIRVTIIGAGSVEFTRNVVADLCSFPELAGQVTIALHDIDAERLTYAERAAASIVRRTGRSEEHTSELQSQSNLVCRLLLEKKKAHASCLRSLARRPSIILFFLFFFNDTATTEIYTLSLHDALPIFEFTRNVVADLCSFPELAGQVTIALHDIDAERLTYAERAAASIVRRTG